MRFGLFVPQGWRHDLVGIEPGEAVGGDARRRPPRRGPRLRVDLGLRPLPHRAGAQRGGHPRGVDADGRVRRGDEPGAARARCAPAWATGNPMYLAKVAATVDAVSGGRVEMGIGAGWYEHEWNAYGYGFPTAGDRIAMLAEGVEIMRQAWEQGVATYAGEHYQVDGAICRPTPLQDGGIPLWIAGGGEKKTLRIAAQHADVHELRRLARGLQAQVAGARGALPGAGPRLRRDRAVGELQRLHRARRGRGDRAGCGRSRTGCGPTCRPRCSRRPCSSTRDRAARRDARADRRAARRRCRTRA